MPNNCVGLAQKHKPLQTNMSVSSFAFHSSSPTQIQTQTQTHTQTQNKATETATTPEKTSATPRPTVEIHFGTVGTVGTEARLFGTYCSSR